LPRANGDGARSSAVMEGDGWGIQATLGVQLGPRKTGGGGGCAVNARPRAWRTLRAVWARAFPGAGVSTCAAARRTAEGDGSRPQRSVGREHAMEAMAVARVRGRRLSVTGVAASRTRSRCC